MHDLERGRRAVLWRSRVTLPIRCTADTIHNVALELEVVIEDRVGGVRSHLKTEKPLADVGRSAVVLVEIADFLPELNQFLANFEPLREMNH